MTSSLLAVTIDCADPAALARFWADVLGWQVAEDSNSDTGDILAPHDGVEGKLPLECRRQRRVQVKNLLG